MSKIHARRDEKGIWRDDATGQKVPMGTPGVCYSYSKKPHGTGKRTTSTISSSRPNTSSNLGIHADQVERFNKDCVPGVEYEKGTGNLISNSWQRREDEARRRGKSFG